VVTSGLEAGEQIAVDTMRLRPGAKVEPVSDEGDGDEAEGTPAPKGAAKADEAS
jgi:hypothetical protein